MTLIDIHNMDKLIELLRKAENYFEKENPSKSMLAHTKSVKSLLDTVKIENEKYLLKDDMYFYFLSYLASAQIHVSSIIRQTNYQDKTAVSIYWDCLTLKNMLRKY